MSDRNKSVIFVTTRESSFLVRSLVNAMGKRYINAQIVAFDNMEFGDENSDVKYACIISEDFRDIPESQLADLRGLCEVRHLKMILLGSVYENNYIKQVLPEECIEKELLRPIDPQEYAEVVDDIIIASLAVGGTEAVQTMKNILVVDDSGIMLRTIMGWLEGKYKVTLANSVQTAVRAMERVSPDLILLDYEMPVSSGPQFLKALRGNSETKNIPVIFLTARGDQEAVNTVLKLNPQGYILKSTPKDEVVAKIDAFFAGNN